LTEEELEPENGEETGAPTDESAEDAPSDAVAEGTPADESAEDAPSDAVAEDAPSDAAEEVEGAEAEPAGAPEEVSGDATPAPEKKPASDLPPGADLEPIPVEVPPELDAEEKARLEAEEQERAEREAAREAEEGVSEPGQAPAPVSLGNDDRYTATGKRKRSVARVTILAGDGKIIVNEREIQEYFPRARHRTVVNSPLVVTGYESNVDIRVRVHGGGISGQAGAVRHGIARALTEVDPNLRGELKRRGFLTRDARAKERRKAGLKKARKRPQFSKR
jgi:small subunit ribosomal protein S9